MYSDHPGTARFRPEVFDEGIHELAWIHVLVYVLC